MLDPELAAATVMIERADLSNPAAARALDALHRENSSSASEETAGRVEWEDRAIPGNGGAYDLLIRVYRPSVRTGSRPGLLFLHGGAFIVGDLESEHPRCLRYSADAESVVVSVAYRLAPENPFPAGFDDAYAALVWLSEHAGDLGVDPGRIGVAGTSAGGNLAAAVALKARDESGPKIAMQLLLHPVLDDRMVTHSMRSFSSTPVWDNRNSRIMWNAYLGETDEPPAYAAPARAADLEGLPCTYILCSELDPARDEALLFGLRLLEARVSVDIRLFAGAYHGFDQSLADAVISRRAIEDQVYAIRTTLRP